MPSDDLKTHALSSQDFYELLSVTPVSSEAEIRRAYRKTALKYHPDKHGGSTEAVEKFHLLQIAYDVLSDPDAKGIYDNARKAREEKEEREKALGARRRQMKEDLERGEKRARDQVDAEDRLQAEIKRLQADGARRRHEKMEDLRREQAEEDERLRQSVSASNGPAENGQPVANGTSGSQSHTELSEMDRAIKVKWRREGSGDIIDKATLENTFKRYGEVESIVVLKDKKTRLAEDRAKTLVATAMIVYKSVASAYAAIEESLKLSKDGMETLESIFWASNEEPSFIAELRTTGSAHSTPSKPAAASTPRPSNDELTRIRLRLAAKRQQEAREAAQKAKDGQIGPAIRKVPSFASFKDVHTPQKPPPKVSFSANSTPTGFNSPGLEHFQKIRQRDEERRKLAEQIMAQEADGDGK